MGGPSALLFSHMEHPGPAWPLSTPLNSDPWGAGGAETCSLSIVAFLWVPASWLGPSSLPQHHLACVMFVHLEGTEAAHFCPHPTLPSLTKLRLASPQGF